MGAREIGYYCLIGNIFPGKMDKLGVDFLVRYDCSWLVKIQKYGYWLNNDKFAD